MAPGSAFHGLRGIAGGYRIIRPMRMRNAPTLVALLAAAPLLASPEEPVWIGDRLELFVDHALIDSLDGVGLRLHAPTPAGVALELDRPWEGLVSGYLTVLRDGEHLRMYYRGRPGTSRADGTAEALEVTCVAESADGVVWTRPELADGTNVVLHGPPGVTHNFAPFLDERPGVPADERYKGLGGTGATGLHAYASADGLTWRPLGDGPVMTDGAFDSQNVAFWSTSERTYVCYLRTWDEGVRWVSRATSEDFLTWSAPVPMRFGDAPREHLYTNQAEPYFRAPAPLRGPRGALLPGQARARRGRGRVARAPRPGELRRPGARLLGRRAPHQPRRGRLRPHLPRGVRASRR